MRQFITPINIGRIYSKQRSSKSNHLQDRIAAISIAGSPTIFGVAELGDEKGSMGDLPFVAKAVDRISNQHHPIF